MKTNYALLALVAMAWLTSCNCGGPSGPSGLSQVYATTANDDGLHVSLVLDDDDNPMVVFMRLDPANSDSATLFFTRYDGKTAAWTAPVVVAANLGRINSNPTRLQAQLARDPKDGRLGIAFQRSEQFCGPVNGNKETTIHLTFSTDQGATWSTSERVSEAKYTRNDPVNGVEVCNTGSPRLALRDGVVHVAWYADAGEQDGLSFHHGYYYAVSTGGGPFTRSLLPSDGPSARKGRGALWLALDSGGAPGVAYTMLSDDAAAPNTTAVLYWRSGPSAVRVVDSANQQNDAPQVGLAFEGTKPRVVAHLARMGQTGTNWVFGADDGTAFTGALVPDDAQDEGGTYLDVSYQGAKGVVAYSFDASRTRGACGGPKLSRATGATGWATCGADDKSHQFLGEYVSLEHTRAGKVVLAFYRGNDDEASPARFKKGVVLYREP